MVVIGTLSWNVNVEGSAEAKAQAQAMSEGMDEAAEQATVSAENLDELSATYMNLEELMGDTSQAAEEQESSIAQTALAYVGLAEVLGDTTEEEEEQETQSSFLASGLLFLGSQVVSLLAKYTALGGVIGAVTKGMAAMKVVASALGSISLGSLVTKIPSVATLIKGMAGLGALVIAVDTIGAMINGKDPITAFVTSAEDFGEFVLNPIGIENDLVEGVAGIGTFILGTMSIVSFITGTSIGAMVSGAGATIASFLGVSSLSALVTGGGATIASYLGFASLGALVTGVGSVAALIYGVVSLGDLIDGDISSWNLPAKFGHALGEGFARAWPDMAESIHNAFTNNPIHGAGEWTGNVLRGEGRGAVTGENRQLSPDAETGFIDPRETPGLSQAYDAGQAVGDWKWTGFASGGIVTGPTKAIIGETGEDEAVIPLSRLPGMLSQSMKTGTGKEVNVGQVDVRIGDQSLDIKDLSSSDMRELADEIADRLGTEVDTIV